MKLLRRESNAESSIQNDDQIKRFIQERCRSEIESFLQPCYRALSSHTIRKQENAKKQVVFFLFKHLVHFCRSKMTLEEFQDKRTWGRIYYPAKIYHSPQGNGESNGFLPNCYTEDRVHFYADLVSGKLWNLLQSANVLSYDLEMKRASLASLKIAGSILLVDESQDMDECQISWMVQQAIEQGAHVYLVGDCAQTIYSFRGAKSKCLMELSNCQDCDLTHSWRFGPNIARVANIVLFAKTKSSQTTCKRPTWRPYRVTGANKAPCHVTDTPLDWHDKNKPVTVIAFTNATLMIQAVTLLGFKVVAENDSEESDDEYGLEHGPEPPLLDRDDGEGQVGVTTAPIDIPRIALNGKGENSGARKWGGVIKSIEYLYNLFAAQGQSMKLPVQYFPDFENQEIDWKSFVKVCQDRELTRYATTISVVQKLQHQTMAAIRAFEVQVLQNKYSADNADVILTTCHAAKGMEWDNVQVSDDFFDLAQVKDHGPEVRIPGTKKMRKTWQIAFKDYGDDANLLYVACTRAKRVLSIPATMVRFLQDCDALQDWIGATTTGGKRKEKSGAAAGILLFGLEKPLSRERALDLYNDIVIPLRGENKIRDDQRLLDVVLTKGSEENELSEDTKMAPETISAKRPLQERGSQNPPCRQEAVDLTWSPPSKNRRRVTQTPKEIIVIDD
jgi:hypothetical protein